MTTVTPEQRDEAVFAASRALSTRARFHLGDGLLHDVDPAEAAEVAVRAALEVLGIDVAGEGRRR